MTIITPIHCKKCGYRSKYMSGCATIGDYPNEGKTSSWFRKLFHKKQQNTPRVVAGGQCPKCGCEEWVVG